MDKQQLQEMQDECTRLKTEKMSLEDENQRLKKELEESKLASDRKVLQSEEKVKKLHRIILDNGLGDMAPIDEEVERLFSQLRHCILQFVKKHCTRHDFRRNGYATPSAEVKDFLAMTTIADALHGRYFAPETPLFGFGPANDATLAHFMASLPESSKSKAIPELKRYFS